MRKPPTSNRGRLLDDSGPRLFVFRMTPFHGLRYRNEGGTEALDFEPWDAPPFYIGFGHLPMELRNEILAEGFSMKTWDRIIEMNVERLTWRQPLFHIGGEFDGGELVSEEVFDALVSIAPKSFSSRAEFAIPGSQSSLKYHLLAFHRYPIEDPGPNSLGGKPEIVGPLCEPPYHGDTASEEFARGSGKRVLAFPRTFARDDKVMQIQNSHRVVTEGFVTRWKSTEISKYLREDNYEHDIQFSLARFGAAYRWVDAPEA